MTRIHLRIIILSPPLILTPTLAQTFHSSIILTRNRATADPSINPATTSEQWFRYSETRLRPVRKAEQRVPRQSTGLARRLDLVLMVLVMYIWKGGQRAD